jgi:hypothetical protein
MKAGALAQVLERSRTGISLWFTEIPSPLPGEDEDEGVFYNTNILNSRYIKNCQLIVWIFLSPRPQFLLPRWEKARMRVYNKTNR